MSLKPTTVISVRGRKRDELLADPDFIYVGRAVRFTAWTSTKWGNPFRPGVVMVAGHNNYRDWLLDQPQLLSQLSELVGKRLGCWCGVWSPGQPDIGCHGIVLATLANALEINT